MTINQLLINILDQSRWMLDQTDPDTPVGRGAQVLDEYILALGVAVVQQCAMDKEAAHV